jgi:hypothetical protein
MDRKLHYRAKNDDPGHGGQSEDTFSLLQGVSPSNRKRNPSPTVCASACPPPALAPAPLFIRGGGPAMSSGANASRADPHNTDLPRMPTHTILVNLNNRNPNILNTIPIFVVL